MFLCVKFFTCNVYKNCSHIAVVEQLAMKIDNTADKRRNLPQTTTNDIVTIQLISRNVFCLHLDDFTWN